MDTTETERIFEIPASRVADAQAKIDKVNRKLTRMGLPTYSATKADLPPRPVYDDRDVRTFINNIPHYFEMGRAVPCPITHWAAYVALTITGETPRLAEWEPVALLARDQDSDVVITRMWPGLTDEPNLSAFRGIEPACDHCKTRRARRDTYVVRHLTTGEMRQIGGTCLEAFTGVRLNINTAFHADDEFAELDEWTAGGGDFRYPVLTVLETTCAVVAMCGWVSKKMMMDSMGGKTATADLVSLAMGGGGDSAANLRAALVPYAADAATKALLVRDHAVALGQTESGEYPQNLSAVATADWVSPRNVPLLASAIAAYARAQEQEIRRATATESQWQGAEKQRLTLALTVTGTRVLDGYMGGTKTLVMMVDAAGNRFKWWASSFIDWEAGDLVTLKGTVKAHEVYQGVKETVLARCAVETLVEAKEVKVDA
jgi:hypothetical protein